MSVTPVPFDPALAEVLRDFPSGGPALTLEDIPALRENGMRVRPLDEIIGDREIDHEDRVIPGPEGAPDIEVTVIAPRNRAGAAPCLVNFHGGGTIMGDRHGDNERLVPLVEEFGAVVVNVEYRLAPEHPAPAPVEDCYAGVAWASAHASELGIDPQKIVVMGGSAGGLLSAGVALLARDHGITLAGQLLICPMLDDTNTTVSSYQYDGFSPWPRDLSIVSWRALLGPDAGIPDAEISPYSAPARATDLSGLAPALIEVGSAELFRDENTEYANRIWATGGEAGIILVFGVAAFMGFEGAAIYREEAKDPKRTVPRATYLAVAIIGVFYAFSAWAFSVGIGPSNIIGKSQEFGPDLMFVFMSDHVSVIFVDIMNLLFITSLFASLQSFHNAVARYFFSLGREGVLPTWFGRTSKSGAPWAGSVTQSAIALVVTIGFAIHGATGGAEALGDMSFLYPVLTMFTWLTNTGAMGLVLLMAVIAVAVIGFFRKEQHQVGLWTSVISPVVSGLLLAWVFVMIILNFHVQMGQETPEFSTYILPIIIAVAGIIGVVWGFALRSSKPQIYEGIGRGTEPGAYGTELIDIAERR